MGFFQQTKDVMKLRGEAKKLEKELKKVHIEAEEGGVMVTVDAKQELISIQIADELSGDLRKIERNTVLAFNRASKKAQEVGAKRMQELMGGMQGMQNFLGGGEG